MKLLRLLLMIVLVSGTSLTAIGQLSEDFEAAIIPPAGWNHTSGSGSWTTSSEVADHTSGIGVFGRYDCYDINGTTPAYLESPKLTVTSGDKTFSFWTNYYFDSGNYGSVAGLTVDVSSNDGTTWTSGMTNYISGQQGADWFLTSIDLSAYEGQDFIGSDVLIRFSGVSDYGSYNIAIDDVSGPALYVSPLPPNCDAAMTSPANAATGINADADISWSAATGLPTGYKLQIGTTPGGSEFLMSTDVGNVTTYDVGTMAYSQIYYVNITPYNANGDATTCTEYNFTTEADPTLTAPFLESFDAAIPSGWVQSATSGGPWEWGGILWNTFCSIEPSDNTGNGGSYIALDHSTPDAGVIIETPPVNVSALTTPQLNFYHYMCIAEITTPNQLYVEAWDGSMWNSVATINTGVGLWAEYTYILTPYVYNTNLVKVRFRAEPGTGTVFYGDQAIDDIAIEEAPTCPNPSAMAAGSITATTADLTWTLGDSELDWNLEWNAAADFAPGTGAQGGSASPTTTPAHSLSILTANTTYYVYYQADCGADQSDWAGPFTFITDIANDVCSGAIFITVYADAIAAGGNETAVQSGGDEGAGANDASCHTNGGQDDDTWYEFVAPANGNKIVLTTVAGIENDWAMVVFDACGGGEVACSDDANNYMPEIEMCQFDYTAGATYYVQIFTYNTNTGTCTLSLYEETACSAPPANNACAAAAAISTDCGAPTSGTTTLATASGEVAPSCGGFGTISDVFYTFNSGTSMLNVDIDITANSGTIESALYTGTCGSSLESSLTICSSGTRTMELRGLAENTDYFFRIWSDPGNDGTFDICLTDQSAAAALPTTSGSCTSAASVTINTAAGNNTTWVPFMIGNNIVATVNANGNDLGAVSAEYYLNAGVLREDGNNVQYLNRNFSLDAAAGNGPFSPAVSIRFYFTQADFNVLAGASSLVNAIGDLNITRIPGIGCAATAVAGGTLESQSGNGTLNGTNRYIQADVLGFSGFFVHGGNAVLPIELVSFTGQAMDKYNQLTWISATEENTKMHYIERSTDGIKDFIEVGSVAAAGFSQEEIRYTLDDNNSIILGYYRLKTVDLDGQVQYSNVISIQRKGDIFDVVNTYPVPTTKELTVEFVTSQDEEVTYTVTDITGKVMLQNVFEAEKGLNKQVIDMAAMSNGVYFLIMQNSSNRVVKNIVKN
ncbi:MAG: hypothetical protein ACJAVF_000184 [Paraglaciecola sp.]|jgi:hypothetical protein